MAIFEYWKPEFWKKRNDGNKMISAEIGPFRQEITKRFLNFLCF